MHYGLDCATVSHREQTLMFSAPTYIVLELPSGVGFKVSELRARYDQDTARLPSEITIAGSSGLGTLSADQNPEEAIEVIQGIARQHLPFYSAFVSMERFPGTQIFWLKPRERDPFDALQRALVAAGLRFNPNPFPFNPHCTISAKSSLSEVQAQELLTLTIPSDEFLLTELCLYQLIQGRAQRLRSFDFGLRDAGVG